MVYSLSAHIAEMLQETYPGRPLPKTKEDIEAYLGPLPTDRELTEKEKFYRKIDEFAINQMLQGDSVVLEKIQEELRQSHERNEAEASRQFARIMEESAVLPQKEQEGKTKAAPVTEPFAEPVTEPVAEPVTEPVTEPVAEPVTEPVAEPVTEPVAEPVTEPVAASQTTASTALVAVPAAVPIPEPELADPLIPDQADAEAEFHQFIEQLEKDNLPEWRAHRQGKVTPTIAEAAREAIQVHCRNLRNLYDNMFERMAAELEQNHPIRDEGFDTSDDEEGEDGIGREGPDELVDNFNLEELVDNNHVAAFHRLVYEMAYGRGNEESDEEDDSAE